MVGYSTSRGWRVHWKDARVCNLFEGTACYLQNSIVIGDPTWYEKSRGGKLPNVVESCLETHPDNTPRDDSLVDKVGLQTRIVAVFESPMLGTCLGICNSPKNRLSIKEDAFEFVLHLVRLPQDRHWDKTLEEGMID